MIISLNIVVILTHTHTREHINNRIIENGVFWDVTPCGSCKNRSFGELGASFIRVTRIYELGTTLAVTSNRRTRSP
jgi:hypothetical protein